MRERTARIGRVPALLQGLLGGAGFAAETLAEALVIAHLGPAWMPVGLAGAAAISLGLTATFTRRTAGRHRLTGLAAVAAALGVGVWATMRWQPALAALLFLLASRPLRDALSVAAGNAITAGYDAQMAKRAWPRLAAAGQTGAIATGLTLPLLLRLGGTQAAIIAWPVLTGAALIVARWIPYARPSGIAPSPPTKGLTAPPPDPRPRYAALLRTLGVTAMLAVASGAALGLTAAMLLASAVPNPVNLASLYVAVGVASNIGILMVQVLILPRIVRRAGTARAALVPPALAMGIAAAAIAGGGLATGLAAQMGRLVVRPALQTPIEEILLGLLPIGERSRGRAWLRGGAIPVAGLVSSLGLAAFAVLGARPPMVAGVALLSATGGLVAAWMLRRQHRNAALALAREQDMHVQRLALPSFGGVDADVKREITRTLATCERDEDRVLLIALLADLDPAAASRAVAERIASVSPAHAAALLTTLADRHCPAAALVPLAPGLLHAPAPSVRRASLAAIGAELSLPIALLVPLLDDPDPAVAVLAIEGLIGRGGAASAQGMDRLSLLARADAPEIRAATAALVAKTNPAILATLLADPARAIRHAAARAAGDLARVPEVLTPALIRASSDESTAVRVHALAALGHQGTAAETLVAALDDPVPRVRLTAANALLAGGMRHSAALSRHVTTLHGWAQTLGLAVLARRAPWRWRSSVLAHEREGLASVERLIGVRDALGTQIGPVGLLLRRDVSDEIADGLDRWQESLGITEGAQAAATIRRGLSEDDAHTRSHALEALEAVRSPELARLAARLLAPPRATEPPDATCARHPPAGGMPSSEALTRGAGRWRMALVAAAAAEQGRSGVDCSTASHDGKDSLMLSLIERATLLRGVPPFADLPSDQLRLLAEVTEEIEVARGETLIAAGTGGEHLYVVIAGQVALEEARGAGGSVARIGTVGPGAALGEDAVFDGGAHVVNATAITDCRMLSLQRDDLLARIEEHPSLAQALIAWLSLRLRETSGKLAERTRARPRSVINLLDQLGDDAK